MEMEPGIKSVANSDEYRSAQKRNQDKVLGRLIS